MADNDNPKDAYNRAHVFKGESYTYWKENMYVHLLSVDKNLWCIVTEGPFISMGYNDVIKHPKDWMNDVTKKSLYDLKTGNILIPVLSVEVFYSISHYTSSKGMWDNLQTLYEGKNNVKDSKINMFTKNFELFFMESGESVDSMQTRFLHLINKLSNMGKTFSNKDCTNKILRSICGEGQPKVIVIKE